MANLIFLLNLILVSQPTSDVWTKEVGPTKLTTSYVDGRQRRKDKNKHVQPQEVKST